jgi:hypothetical protein
LQTVLGLAIFFSEFLVFVHGFDVYHVESGTKGRSEGGFSWLQRELMATKGGLIYSRIS